jgi:hypothetical protein
MEKPTLKKLEAIAIKAAWGYQFAPPAVEPLAKKLGKLLTDAVGVLRQIEKVEAVLAASHVECRECNADDVPITDGLCEECAGLDDEECEVCDGTGSVDSEDAELGLEDCDECGGTGVY